VERVGERPTEPLQFPDGDSEIRTASPVPLHCVERETRGEDSRPRLAAPKERYDGGIRSFCIANNVAADRVVTPIVKRH